MLYLITPSAGVSWSATSRQASDEIGGLDWAPAELRADASIVRLALRHGRAAHGGIVVDSVHLNDHNRMRRLLDTQSEARSVRAGMGDDYDAMESRSEGGRARREAQDARIDAAADSDIASSRATVREALRQDSVDPELVDHWRRLGGSVPDPL
ncbi:MAG TPA: hypothetical protein VIL55_00060 [Naasia sp.]